MKISFLFLIAFAFQNCEQLFAQEKTNSDLANSVFPEPKLVLSGNTCFLLLEIYNPLDSSINSPRVESNSPVESYGYPYILGRTTEYKIPPKASYYALFPANIHLTRSDLLLAMAKDSIDLPEFRYTAFCNSGDITLTKSISIKKRLKDLNLISVDTVVLELNNNTFNNSTIFPILGPYFLVYDTLKHDAIIVQKGTQNETINNKEIDIQHEDFLYYSSDSMTSMVLKIQNTSDKYLILNSNLNKVKSYELSIIGYRSGKTNVLAPGSTLFLRVKLPTSSIKNNSFKMKLSDIFSNCNGKKIQIKLSDGHEIK